MGFLNKHWIYLLLGGLVLIAGIIFMPEINNSELETDEQNELTSKQENPENHEAYDPIGEEVSVWLKENEGNYKTLARVEAGDVIGKTGSSGNSTGAHLHLGIWNPESSQYENPVHNRRTNKLKHGFSWPYQNEDWQVSRWFDCTGFWTSAERTQCPYTESSWGSGRFFHNGVDVAAPSGSLVRSIGDGNIIYRGVWGGAGYTVMIEHDNGFISRYFHLLPF